jgi:hypothetical protein
MFFAGRLWTLWAAQVMVFLAKLNQRGVIEQNIFSCRHPHPPHFSWQFPSKLIVHEMQLSHSSVDITFISWNQLDSFYFPSVKGGGEGPVLEMSHRCEEVWTTEQSHHRSQIRVPWIIGRGNTLHHHGGGGGGGWSLSKKELGKEAQEVGSQSEVQGHNKSVLAGESPKHLIGWKKT